MSFRREEIVKKLDDGAIDFVNQVKNVEEIGNKLVKAIENIGVIGGYLDVGNAIYETWEHLTAGNITKAALKSVLAVVKTNPVVNLVTSIADVTGLTDWVLNGKM